MRNTIQSMYKSVKSRVKYHNKLGDICHALLGVRQGESLSPFLFSMFLNDIEDECVKDGVDGVNIDLFKLF